MVFSEQVKHSAMRYDLLLKPAGAVTAARRFRKRGVPQSPGSRGSRGRCLLRLFRGGFPALLPRPPGAKGLLES